MCDGSLKCLTRKWRFIDAKHQMKILNSYTVKLEFVYSDSAHDVTAYRRWDLVTWLRPWDQTTNYAVEGCQWSSRCRHQLSWQDNVHCFLGCWRYTADWLHAAQGDITGAYCANLLCKLLIRSKEKRQGKLTQVPVVLHDKTITHLCSHILDRLLYLNGFWKKCTTHHECAFLAARH